MPTIAVLGAGIAGLKAGGRLQAAGWDVTVFEKSRGTGGRTATRRLDGGVTFDHGAQYFTVRDPAFAEQVDRWRQANAVAEWTGRIVKLVAGQLSDLPESTQRFVGVPAMNAVAKQLAVGLAVQTDMTVKSLQQSAEGTRLVDDASQSHGPFDWVLSTAPPPQTAALFQEHSAAIAERLPAARMAPCWAVLARFAAPLSVPLDGAFVHQSPLTWIARNSSKPGRGGGDSWVLHAGEAWTVSHLEDAAEAVAADLLAEFWQATGLAPQTPEYVAAHRWRYALPTQPLAERFLIDPKQRLAAAGDWCNGPRVEGAFLSGRAVAEALLAT